MPNIIAVIPARYGATRFEGKMLTPIGGKPLIQHVYERAQEIPSLNELIIATDDERIYEAAVGFSAPCVMTSPDCPSGTDRIYEVVRDRDVDLVVNIQGDEPLIDSASVEALITAMSADDSIAMGTLAFPTDDEAVIGNPHVVKVVCDDDQYALYFSRSPIPYRRTIIEGEPMRGVLKHIGLYSYRAAFLKEFVAWQPSWLERTEGLEQLRALDHRVRIKVVIASHDSIGVDVPEDITRIASLLASPQ